MISWLFVSDKSLRRILLQRLIRMSIWNINILFGTKHSARSSESWGGGAGIWTGNIKMRGYWSVSCAGAGDSRQFFFVTFSDLIQTRWCCERMHAANVERIMNTRVKYPDQAEMCVWHELTTNTAFVETFSLLNYVFDFKS